MRQPVIAVFDIGKTNKKLFLFNEAYQIVFEKTEHFEETVDDDGDPCEDVRNIQSFIERGLTSVLTLAEFSIRAVNFSAYGASLLYVDESGKTIGYLYNYLKPFPEKLREQFYESYGGEKVFSYQTASPALGSLNSGMQLYRVRHLNPDFFNRIKYALHLPQYLSYLVTGQAFSEITSIGCHTNLWHFQNMDYHYWLKKEGVLEKLPPIAPSDMVLNPQGIDQIYAVGVGLHDSSAALIPYLVTFEEPFVLISTGTWAISLNPFNSNPLTKDELECDCLCFLQYKGTPVKASRLFAGHHHDVELERIAAHFNHSKERYYRMEFDADLLSKIDTVLDPQQDPGSILQQLRFSSRNLSDFSSDAEAYHQLIFDLVVQQYTSTQLVIKGSPVRKIFVDGGFGSNAVYMNLLAQFFPQMDVLASSIPQASAIGAALAIHEAWNPKAFPAQVIELKRYSR